MTAEAYKEIIEQKICEEIPKMGLKNPLRDAIEYSLTNGGKRFRPILVLMIANALGYEVDASYAALSVEYSHTSSLIADDLPCMDDDDMRRNKPSVHKVYGESTALLASYALMSAGYECLAKNARELPGSRHPRAHAADTICRLALENTTFNGGAHRLIGGQFLDIYPPNVTADVLRDVITKKTVSLFEISFVLGWLYGGGDPEKLPSVKKSAEHFGLAFQIADDFGDMEQDTQNERAINAAAILGVDGALEWFHEEIKAYRALVRTLEWDPQELLLLADMVVSSTKSFSDKFLL